MLLKRTTLLIALTLVATVARADGPACRTVEVQFTPGAKDLQIVAWVEDLEGNYVDTAYITRATGQFGLGNRPGEALLKTNFGWPYGRREMVAPIWAHKRNHHYPLVVMGGACAGKSVNSPTAACGDSPQDLCDGDCVDSTIAYHSRVSSYEPHYCSPSGPSSIDVMSCASRGTFSKGAFADAATAKAMGHDPFSLYPPRADLDPPCNTGNDCPAPPGSFPPSCKGGRCVFDTDSPDTMAMSGMDDLVAISQATPSLGQPVSFTWFPPSGLADGDYVLWLEASMESDFNAAHDHPNKADTVSNWDFEGHKFLGQPSIVYRVPFTINGTAATASTGQYYGYSTWDGSDGVIHQDDSITTTPPTKAGDPVGQFRLAPFTAPDGTKALLAVVVGGCGDVDGGTCTAPAPVDKLAVSAASTSLTVSWTQPDGTPPGFYEVRYREGMMPITDADFDAADASSDPPPSPGKAGDRLTTTIHMLNASTNYAVAVRSRSVCGAKAPVMSVVTATADQNYTTLSGCFIATAAYGQPNDVSVEVLRKFRDEHLLPTPAGRLFAAAYYAFSPPFARAIASHPSWRAAVRRALAPLVKLAAAVQ